MIKHIKQWNKWRKSCLNGKLYKFLVLIGIIESPTMAYVLLDSEEEAIHKAFMDGFIEWMNGGKLVMEGTYFFFGYDDKEDDGLFFCVGEHQKSDNNNIEADRSEDKIDIC